MGHVRSPPGLSFPICTWGRCRRPSGFICRDVAGKGAPGRRWRVCAHMCACVCKCVHSCPLPGSQWKGGRDSWGPGLRCSWFNYRFSAAGRWARVGKEGGPAPKPCHFPASEGLFKGGHPDIFSTSRRVDCRGPSMSIMTGAFCNKLGVNGSDRLVSCQTSHYYFFFFLSFADSLGFMCFSLFSPFPPAWKNG